MQDLTTGCLEDLQSQGKRPTVKDLRNSFCIRCKNAKCGHADFSGTPWDHRMLTQQDRLLDNPVFADPADPQYDFVRKVEWQNMVRDAIRLNVSERRGDWTVPDVRPALFVAAPPKPPEEDIDSQTQTTDMVDDAVKTLAAARGKESPNLPPPVEDESQELSTFEEEEPIIQAEVVQPEIVQPTVQRTAPPSSIPAVRNTRVPRGGVMIGRGGRAANGPQRNTRPVRAPRTHQNDPWAVPTKVIKPGATISLKSGKKK